MVLYEFILNAAMHIFLIIIIQIGLFKFIISKAETDGINGEIVHALKKSSFYNTIKENLQSYQMPQTCVQSDNNNWTVNLYLQWNTLIYDYSIRREDWSKYGSICTNTTSTDLY